MKPTFLARLGTVTMLLAALALGNGPKAHTPLAWLDTSGSGEEVRYLFWQQQLDGQPIPFKIGNAGTPDITIPSNHPDIDEFEAMELAFDAWENIPGATIQFAVGSTAINDFGFDGENVIFFADLGDVGYGGVTSLTYDNTTGQLLDVDIHMNDHNIRWVTSHNAPDGEPLPCPCQGEDPNALYYNDAQGLATHEVGHALGLDHSAVGIRESATTPTMYARGIWFVPGDPTPPNSRYRSIELDDEIGIQTLYPPVGWAQTTGMLEGIVHDRFDVPLFGAHVVAKNLATGVEVGVMSGMVAGPYQAEVFVLAGLPPATYQVRVEPLDYSPPGFIGPGNFGGIENAVVTLKWPAETELDPMYHRLVFSASQATPVSLAAGTSVPITFRPIGTVDPLPALIRIPHPFDFTGKVNADVTGPLQSASFIYAINKTTVVTQALSVAGGPYTVSVPQKPSGTLIEYRIEVQTTAGSTLATLPRTIQIGLSGQPLIYVSKTGSWELSAVDAGTLFEVDVSDDGHSFPLGQAMHQERYGVFVANFGFDDVTFVPLFTGSLPPTTPLSFDDDGDGLLDALEPKFGTGATNPDSDGDFALDGTELSERRFVHPGAGSSYFDVLGGTLASNGTPVGATVANIALWNVTDQSYDASLSLTPTGRFRLRLPVGKTFWISYYDAQTGQWLADTASWSGGAGATLDGGVKTLGLAAPNPPVPDTGTDPLDENDGAPAVFLPTAASIALEPGADPYDVALGLYDQQYLYATGSGTNKVYKIDTETDLVVASATVGDFPKGIAVTPDGAKVYVAHPDHGLVTVLDAATMSTLTTLNMPGEAQQVRITPDGSTAIVITSNNTGDDVTLIDTALDVVIEGLESGHGGLVFLSQVNSCDERVLASDFAFGPTEVAWVDAGDPRIVALHDVPGVDSTSGVALHHDGVRGYAVNYYDPKLLEIDLTTGAVVRSLAFDFIDIRDINIFPDPDVAADPDGDGVGASDNCPCAANANQSDYDGDGVGQVCDNCPFFDNPLNQLDLNGNGVGDACECRRNADCNDGIPCTLDKCLWQLGGSIGMCKITHNGC